MQLSRIICFSLIIIFPFSEPIRADLVKSVTNSGVLELAESRIIQMAGIQLEADFLPMVRSLIAGKDVELEAEGDYWYVYISTKELPLPFTSQMLPDEKRILLNAFLIELGAARVDQNQVFREKKNFMNLEAQAREKGQGVWSYESN